MKKIEILEKKTVCRVPGSYLGWPTITQAPNKDLLTVFSGERFGHVGMKGSVQMVRSKDNGQSWGDPVTITDTPLSDGSTGIMTTAAGTVIMTFSTEYYHPDDPRFSDDSVYGKAGFFKDKEKWRPYAEKVTDEDLEKWMGKRSADNRFHFEIGKWLRRSTDNGFTWEDPIRVAADSTCGPVQLSDGSLLYPGHGDPEHLVIQHSFDDGKSWEITVMLDSRIDAKNGYLCEPHAVETDEGRVIIMFRYEIRDVHYKSVLWQAESVDRGKTWSRPHPTNVLGEPPHLLKLKNGSLLLTYGRRRDPFSERACFSHDGGRTWDIANEVILHEHAFGDFGYPASVELDDGTIITVYYGREKADELQCISATYWRPLG